MSFMHLSPRAIGTHKALAGLGRHRSLEPGNQIFEAAETPKLREQEDTKPQHGAEDLQGSLGRVEGFEE